VAWSAAHAERRNRRGETLRAAASRVVRRRREQFFQYRKLYRLHAVAIEAGFLRAFDGIVLAPSAQRDENDAAALGSMRIRRASRSHPCRACDIDEGEMRLEVATAASADAPS